MLGPPARGWRRFAGVEKVCGGGEGLRGWRRFAGVGKVWGVGKGAVEGLRSHSIHPRAGGGAVAGRRMGRVVAGDADAGPPRGLRSPSARGGGGGVAFASHLPPRRRGASRGRPMGRVVAGYADAGPPPSRGWRRFAGVEKVCGGGKVCVGWRKVTGVEKGAVEGLRSHSIHPRAGGGPGAGRRWVAPSSGTPMVGPRLRGGGEG